MYQDLVDQISKGKGNSKKIDHNTYLTLEHYVDLEGIDCYEIVCRLHGNRIATATQDRIKLHNSGWFTVTTKDRLNKFLALARIPVQVYQHDWSWYLSPSDALFWGGIQVDYHGRIIV